MLSEHPRWSSSGSATLELAFVYDVLHFVVIIFTAYSCLLNLFRQAAFIHPLYISEPPTDLFLYFWQYYYFTAINLQV